MIRNHIPRANSCTCINSSTSIICRDLSRKFLSPANNCPIGQKLASKCLPKIVRLANYCPTNGNGAQHSSLVYSSSFGLVARLTALCSFVLQPRPPICILLTHSRRDHHQLEPYTEHGILDCLTVNRVDRMNFLCQLRASLSRLPPLAG